MRQRIFVPFINFVPINTGERKSRYTVFIKKTIVLLSHKKDRTL
jgi:hypothetical protein